MEARTHNLDAATRVRLSVTRSRPGAFDAATVPEHRGRMLLRLVVLGALVGLFGLTRPASAAPILQVTSGTLTGAKNVDVNGTLYDVEFVEGTCHALFTGCDEASDFTFGTDHDQAYAAINALLATVFVDGPGGQFDSDPELTFGCTSVDFCRALIPFVLFGEFTLGNAVNWSPEQSDDFGSTHALDPLVDSTSDETRVYTRFTPVPVPEPTSVALLAVGLAGLGARRWRRQSSR